MEGASSNCGVSGLWRKPCKQRRLQLPEAGHYQRGLMAARALGLQQGHMGRSGFQKARTGLEQALLLQDLTQQDWMRSHRIVTFLKEYLLLIFFKRKKYKKVERKKKFQASLTP